MKKNSEPLAFWTHDNIFKVFQAIKRRVDLKVHAQANFSTESYYQQSQKIKGKALTGLILLK